MSLKKFLAYLAGFGLISFLVWGTGAHHIKPFLGMILGSFLAEILSWFLAKFGIRFGKQAAKT